MIALAGSKILAASPKHIALSGPSGFLGRRVLESILDIFLYRHENNVEPGKILLLTSSPGRLMKRLSQIYGRNKMQFIRASRVDFFTQHSVDMWQDNLASLGFVDSDGLVFCNLAAISGPLREKGDRMTTSQNAKYNMEKGQRGDTMDSMMNVNYHSVAGAAKACEKLGFEHFIQSSSQAVNVERAGQVLYSRGKSMADAMLLQREAIKAVSIVRLGLLYCKDNIAVGQDGSKLNLVDLAKLPLTPILGNGLARLQPMERGDAGDRIAYLATMDVGDRPLDLQPKHIDCPAGAVMSDEELMKARVRIYDAVGPETFTMKELLEVLAEFQGRKLYPIHVDYYNMERILNVASLGNYNRQFVSILRSEQDIEAADTKPLTMTGDPMAFHRLFHEDAQMLRLQDAFGRPEGGRVKKRIFPVWSTAKWVCRNPGVIRPGIALGLEISRNFLFPSFQDRHLAVERAMHDEKENSHSLEPEHEHEHEREPDPEREHEHEPEDEPEPEPSHRGMPAASVAFN